MSVYVLQLYSIHTLAPDSPMITREVDYAIRAVLYLSMQDGRRLVATSELAEEMVVPYRFLRRIVQKLVDGGLVEAQRGKGGGVRLTRTGGEISLFDVLQTIDPKALCLNACLNGAEACVREPFCTVRQHLDGLQGRLDGELRGFTFDVLRSAPTAAGIAPA
jgi:Rrf2 family transcriptional regulator, nitric oxide-sensitive transcriptional repressor